MPDRVMIYIDGSNLYHSLQDNCSRTDVDFQKLCSKLADSRRLVRAYYYGARVDQAKQPQNYSDQQKFFAYLENTPDFELRIGQLIYRNWPSSGPYEKGVDVKLATDMLIHAFRDNYEVAILVSGDTDFVDVVQAVKDLGKTWR